MLINLVTITFESRYRSFNEYTFMDPFILCLLSLGISFAKLRLPLSCVAQTERLSSSEFWGIDDSTRQNLVNLKQRAGDLLDLRYVSRRNFATGGLDAITDGGTNRDALHR
jgi:hypothetical protein